MGHGRRVTDRPDGFADRPVKSPMRKMSRGEVWKCFILREGRMAEMDVRGVGSNPTFTVRGLFSLIDRAILARSSSSWMRSTLPCGGKPVLLDRLVHASLTNTRLPRTSSQALQK